MKVAVDARLLRSGGIGTFIREVVAPWTRERTLAGLHLLGRPSELGPWLEALDPAVPVEVTPWEDPPYAPLAHLRWPLRLARSVRTCDVAFFPHYDVPLFGPRPPSVVVVHDLTHFLLPDRFPRWKRAAGRLLLTRAVRGARHVVTVSERTREDLLCDCALGAQASGVTVVPNGVSGVFRPLTPEEEREARARWGPLGPFFLLVGWDRPHKNAEMALAVVDGLARRGRECRLVLAGNGGRMAPPIRREARRRGIEGRLHEAGHLDEAGLRQLYGLSAGLLHPSLYEGFGLPVLEAMACGAPVLCSDRGALPEIAGPATVLPAEDETRWVDAAEALLGRAAGEALQGHAAGEALHGRAAGEARGEAASAEARAAADCAAGLAHAARYRWEEASRAVLEIVRACADDPGGEGRPGPRPRATGP